MSLNRDRIYNALPGRYRRADTDLFLRRFLTFAGETLDEWDAIYDGFSEQIDPATADEEWIDFWLAVLFGWAWFPWWFTLADKRTLYGHFARHLARRGTERGIREWLADFGIVTRIWMRPAVWGEAVWGEPAWSFDQPLKMLIEILHLKDRVNHDVSFFGDAAWGEMIAADPQLSLTEVEIDNLIRFVWPLSNDLWRVWSNFPSIAQPNAPAPFNSYLVVLPL